MPSQLLLVILIRAPDAARRQDDGLGLEHVEASALAVVGQHAGRAPVVEEQLDDRVLHVHGHALVDGVILQRANQLEAGAIADVREPRIAVTAEVALVDAAVRRAIEDRAPALELAHAIGRFLRVQLRHAPVVDVLAAAHRVREVHLPAVAIVVVRHRRGHAALGHHGVRLAEERLADQSDGHAGVGGLNRRAKPGAAGADDQDVVAVGRVARHQMSLTSVRIPIEHSRTYRSDSATENRLIQAKSMCRPLRALEQL